MTQRKRKDRPYRHIHTSELRRVVEGLKVTNKENLTATRQEVPSQSDKGLPRIPLGRAIT